ncbi:MAG: cytochrome C oxidase subunit IV family protein [Anaerolineae bacterium]
MALALLTGVEIAIAESGIIAPPASIILLTVLSVAKLVLVAMYYMHLYGDNPILVAIFLIPVPFVLLIIGALLLEFDAFRAVFGL